MITASAPAPAVKIATSRSGSGASRANARSAPRSMARLTRVWVYVTNEHPATRRLQQLHGQLANGPKADDDHRLSQRWTGAAHALESYCAQGHGARFGQESFDGTCTARLTGTRATAAWLAIPAPAHATRSPGRKPSTSAATALTRPAAEYPSTVPLFTCSRTNDTVRRTPCALTISIALLTLAGFRAARRHNGALAEVMPLNSVPVRDARRAYVHQERARLETWFGDIGHHDLARPDHHLLQRTANVLYIS